MMVNYIIGYLCFFFENEDAGKLYKPLVFGLLTLQTNPSTELRFVGSWFVDLFTWYIPDAPCMVYLPTFGWFLGHMLVNIPYMEHMGISSGTAGSHAIDPALWVFACEDGELTMTAPLLDMESNEGFKQALSKLVDLFTSALMSCVCLVTSASWWDVSCFVQSI